MFKRPLVWILAAFVIVCLLNDNVSNPMDQLFEDEIECKVDGTVWQIINKENGTSLHLKDVTIYPTKGGRYHCNKLLIYLKQNQPLKVGNQVNLSGTILKFRRPTNPGQFNEFNYYKTIRMDYKMYAENIFITDASYSRFRMLLCNIRNRMVQVYGELLDEKDAGILDAMMLGEMGLLDTDVKTLYQKSGISHILAISSLHISMIGMLLFLFLKKLKIPLIPTSIFTAFIVISYGILTGFSVSTNRAVIMLLLSLTAGLIGRTYDLITSLSLSAIIILYQSPLQLANGGFLLSFGAMLGIAYLVPLINQLVAPPPEEEKKNNTFFHYLMITAWNGFVVSFCTNLVTLPVILYFYYEFPLYGVFLNILIIPIMSLAVVLAMAGGIAGCFLPFLGKFLLGSVHYILISCEFLCEFFAKLPYSVVVVGRPNPILILLYYFILILFIYASRKSNKKITLLLLPLLCVLFIRFDNKELEVTALDVGQGDAIFIETPEHTKILIDGGSSDVKQVGKYRMVPFLKSKGIGRVDYVIVTHGDSDHISGIHEILSDRSIRIDSLVVSYANAKQEGIVTLIDLAKQNKTKIIYVQTGDMIKDDKMKLTCLHPTKEFESESLNAYSTVMSLEYGRFQALFTGDLEKDGEEVLLNKKEETRLLQQYDLLKVGHHGSKYSTSTELLDWVSPRISFISCGKNNRYGHPHPELIERLNKAGSKSIFTMDSGAITVKTDGKTIQVIPYIKSEKP